MLTKIIIEKLFDKFDYTIELKPEGITILTGPNGYGKTTVLKILDALAKGDVRFFIQLPFERISLEFSDVEHVVLFKENGELPLTINGEKQKILWYLGDRDKDRILREVESRHPYFHRLEETHWLDQRSDKVLTEEELLQKIVMDDPRLVREFSFERTTMGVPRLTRGGARQLTRNFPALRHLNISKVYFIREQRLLRPKSDHFTNTVEEYALDLNNKIKDILATSSKIAQELDSSFPRRLFEQKTQISKNEFNERFDKVKEVQKSLSNYGFSEFKEDSHPAYREEDARALAVYIEDTEKKLGVFAELLEKLNLFTEILNERRFTFKQIHISKDEGFTLSTDDGKSLRLQDLSSGEQQEVVILYELLFRVQPNTLVLIDEPELSLHVVWQQEFLNDLEKIVAWQKIQVIIATHSPQIINEHWDLVVDLWDLHHAKHTG